MTLSELADRCERLAISRLKLGFDGFDNMRHSEGRLDEAIMFSAAAFNVAASLRARSLMGEG